MSDVNDKHPSINDALSKRTSIFGLRLWVVVGIGCGAGIVVILFLISLWFTSKRNHKVKNKNHHPSSSSSSSTTTTTTTTTCTSNINNKPTTIPNISKEIQEIRIDPIVSEKPTKPPPLIDQQQQQQQVVIVSDPIVGGVHEDGSPIGGRQRIHVDIGKGNNRISYPEKPLIGTGGSSNGSGDHQVQVQVLAAIAAPEVSHLGWGHWYTLRELEEATNGFVDENVIGEGGYGIVYRGVLEDNSRVAVKNLLNNRGQAEREFKVEVEAIGRVRHKNLVRLLGYCAEGAHRMLVYEYVNNGNLEQWIHGDVGPYSPLTWDIRMHIALGTAKGLTYLHEGLEPKVVHRDIKSSNILLDKQWNAKVSDFGLAKLLGSERNYVTTRVMGTFGYVAPEYASTGMLNERSDVYSFGILLMELISGRNPVDYSRPPGEVNMVDWLKTMVTDRNSEGVLDPKIPEKPSSRSLKRAILVALRCVDPNAQKRPKMGHVIHMLETDDFPLRDDRRPLRDSGRNRLMEKRVSESGDSSGYESCAQPNKLLPWRKLDQEQHDEEEQ